MLEVHIPSVGPEAEAPKQSPEKGHMVSGGTGWEGVQEPPDFPEPSAVGTPRLGLGRPSAAAEAVGGQPAEDFGALEFASPTGDDAGS